MNETNFRGVAIKGVAIIGFFATIILIAWIVAEGIKRAPDTFSSLASITETITNYRAVHELSLATEKTVVNSDESFQISWTDVRQTGEYHFSYTCTAGVDLLVRDAEGALVPVGCTDVLTVPATVHGLFINVTSEDMRFTDIPLKVTFTSDKTEEVLESQTKITVVNATIPTTEQPVVAVIPTETPIAVATPEPTVPAQTEPIVTSQGPTQPEQTTPVITEPAPKPTPAPVAKPVMTAVYPTSNPNGYVDLSVKTLGSGILKDGVFVYTAKYDRDLQNSIKFDIRNIGTKTSEAWAFLTTLPDGTLYRSEPQIGLKPNEHVEFTLSFKIDDDVTKDFVEVKNTVYTTTDTVSSNNTSVWSVAVQN